MSLGAGIFLIAVGAILAFAITVTPTWIDLHVVGYILMAAGVIVLILGIILIMRHRRSTVTRRRYVDPANGDDIQSTSRDDPRL